MENKIALIYDGKAYQVVVNEHVILDTKKIEEAYGCFDKTVKNNKLAAEGSWESIKSQVESYLLDDVEIYEDYKAIQYKTVKYFYNTGKLFYINQEEMLPLNGGHGFMLFLLERVALGQLMDSDGLIELCVEATKKDIVYRMKESSFGLFSPIFNYGNVSYNFHNQEIHKGTHMERDTFEKFREYVLETIR